MNQRVTKASPPIAQQHPHRLLSSWGHERTDPYFWMHDANDPKLKAYLEAENAYTNGIMQHTEEFQKILYEEMLARIQETDLSLPYRSGDYLYYWRTEAGQSYCIFCRRKADVEESEEILLDGNKLAQGYEYFNLGLCQISPDRQTLAYLTDTIGNERYSLQFLDLKAFNLYSEKITAVDSFSWSNDSCTVFYTQIDSTNRPDKCWRHTLGSNPTNDILVYQENKEGFYLGTWKARSEKYILLSSAKMLENEIFYLDADHPTGSFQSLCPHTSGVRYLGFEHHEDFFYIITNEKAINQKLMKAPVTSPSTENWVTVVPHREEVLLEDLLVLSDYLIFCEREGGLPKLRIHQISTGEEHYLDFPDPVYELSINPIDNLEFDTTILRFCYKSLVTPDSIYDYNLETRESSLQKQISVLGNYDKNEYVSQRVWAKATDGQKIPISLVYKKGLQRNGNNPLLLASYGAYTGCEYIYFSAARLSLLDRGVVFAVAHVRGGREMGFGWHEDGRLLNKKNTFTDFIACAEHLVFDRWTSTENLAIWGESAGGLLVGAVINMNPNLCKVAIARVPFVDVLTSISDTTLPLSVLDWDEWGNPNEQTYYDYIKSYSPYDNVCTQDYPDLLITTGIQDVRVNYREPVKWTAKLRSLKTSDKLLLLRTNIDSGHLGGSGRYQKLKEQAFEYAFILDRLKLIGATQ
jgi:oligopeptidase B